MPSLLEMVDNVFLRLGDPRSNRPGYFQALNQVCEQTRTLLRHHRNTSNPWNFNDLVVNVSPTLNTYQILQTDFGTPLVVVTYAPQLPTWVSRPVPFFTPQNMPFDWEYPNNMASWAFLPGDGSNCTAQRCAFYWRDNIAYVEFQPTPQLQAQYKVRYLQAVANQVGDMALATSPLQNEDCDLVEVRASLALLALTEWMAPDSKDGRSYNAERRKDLANTMLGEEKELRRQFEAASLITTGPQMSHRWTGSIVG